MWSQGTIAISMSAVCEGTRSSVDERIFRRKVLRRKILITTQLLVYMMKFLTINQATTDAAMPTMTGSE